MRHLMLFEDFPTDIFQDAHAAIEEDVLIPLETLIKRGGYSQLPTSKQLRDAINLLGLEPEESKYFYYNPQSIIEPIIFWDGQVYLGFLSGNITKEVIEMMQMKRRIEQKRKLFKNAIDKGEWERLFTDKKIAIPIFIKHYDKIPTNKKYEIFLDIYQRSEYGFDQFPEELIMELLTKHAQRSSDRRKRMVEFKNDAKLNDDGTVTVFRGQNTESALEDEAYSWTLKEDTAEFFANRFTKGTGEVIQKNIDPKHVIDYLSNRGEAEVILVPRKFR